MSKKKLKLQDILLPQASTQTRSELINSLMGITLEILITHGFMFVLFFFVPAIKNSFLEMNIHPLLVITAVIGIRHGYLAGLTSALLSSLVYLSAYLILGLNLPLFFSTYGYYKFLIMFFVIGYSAGRIRDTYARNVHEMKQTNSDLLDEFTKLESSYQKSVETYNELRNQIIGSETSIFSLYEIATSLQTTNPERIYTESIGLLHKFIKATTISIYTLESGGYMRLKIIFGDYTRKRSSIRFVDNPKYVQLVEAKTAVRWSREENEDFPLFSAPIMNEESVIGIINIDNIEFEHTTEYSFSIFRVISEWISKALSHAIEIDRKYNITGVSWSNFLKKKQFDMQLKEEEIRLKKYGLPYCYGKFKVLTEDVEDAVFAIRKVLRSVDFVCHDDGENTIEILLPATGSFNYLQVLERIRSSVGDKVEELE